MENKKIVIAAFSPTRTSLKVARAVAEGLERPAEVCELDATYRAAEACTLSGADLLLASVPVYGGAVAPLALERLKALSGNGTPAVVIAVYGNRAFGHAPQELARFLTERGFKVIAAAAFVGEHSYSTELTPIAPARPNAADLEDARRLGRAIARKLQQPHPQAVDAARLPQPKSGWLNMLRFVAFVLGHRRRMKKHPVPVLPQTDAARCTRCGLCAGLCPTGAIAADAPEQTDPSRCIRCAACVKGCKRHARTLQTPFARPLSRNFKKQKNNVTLL